MQIENISLSEEWLSNTNFFHTVLKEKKPIVDDEDDKDIEKDDNDKFDFDDDDDENEDDGNSDDDGGVDVENDW